MQLINDKHASDQIMVLASVREHIAAAFRGRRTGCLQGGKQLISTGTACARSAQDVKNEIPII